MHRMAQNTGCPKERTAMYREHSTPEAHTAVFRTAVALTCTGKGFGRHLAIGKKSLFKAYVITYLYLFVTELKLNGLCSLSSTKTAAALK